MHRGNEEGHEDASDSDEEHSWNEEMFRIIKCKIGFFRNVNEESILRDIQNCVREGANIHYQDRSGNTLLHIAIKKKYLIIIDYLLSLSQSWDILNNKSVSPRDLVKGDANITSIFDKYSTTSNKDVNEAIIINAEEHQQEKGSKRERTNSSDDSVQAQAQAQAQISHQNLVIDSPTNKRIRTGGSLFDFPTHHKSSGLKHSLHGAIYQLKLHMLVMKRGLNKGYSFRLATEMDEAEKFDDLVFIYEDQRGRIKYWFLQAKHKQDESVTITANDLLTESSEGEYGLQKYFASFRKIMRSLDIKGECESFVLCTNITFDPEKCKDFKLVVVQEVDELLDSNSNKCGTKYKFDVKNSAVKNEVYDLLKCTSDLYVLAKQLHKCGEENKDLTLRIPIFKSYHGVLVNENILVKDRDVSKKNPRYYAVYDSNFLNNSTSTPLSKSALLLRELLISFEADEKTFIQKASSVRLAISSNFGNVYKLDESPQISDCKALSEKLVNSMMVQKASDVVPVNKETSKSGVIKDNINKIAGHFFVKDNDDIVVNSDFIDSATLPGNLMDFRNELSQLLAANNMQPSDLLKLKFKIANYQTCEKDEIDVKRCLPSDVVTDAEIDNFFGKLIFAVNQPNEIELEEIIKSEIGEDAMFNLLNVDLVSDSFQKELLDWFKEKGCVKGSEGRFLSTEDARGLFRGINYKIDAIIGIGLSLSYPQQLNSFRIKFNRFNEQVRDFLAHTNGKQVLNISSESVFLSSLKLNDLLKQQTGPELRKQDSVIFVHCETAFKLKEYIRNAFKSNKSHRILIIACEKCEDFQSLLTTFFDITAENAAKKIIILTENASRVALSGFDLLSVRDTCNFDDFSADTVKVLENKLIHHQGYEIEIGRTTPKWKYIIDTDTLVKLIVGDKITVGKDLEGLKEIGEYYVERQFLHGVEFNLHVLRNFHKCIIALSNVNADLMNRICKEFGLLDNHNQVVAVADEDQFQGLLQANENANIYWFKYDSITNRLILQKSSGPVCNLNEYACNRTFTEQDMLNKSGFTILANYAGMGKSTNTICLTNKLKHTNPAMWVLRINLSSCTDALEEELHLRSVKADDAESAIEFLVEHLMQSTEQNKLSTVFEKRLFKSLFNEPDKLAIFLDSFDEISPTYERIVLELTQSLLSSTKASTIWVTSRPSCQKLLEDRFGVVSHRLKILTAEEQVHVVKKIWQRRLRDLKHTVNGGRVKTIAKSAISYLTNAINDKSQKLTGIPLIAKMVADVYFDKFLICYNDPEEKWQLEESFNFADLFDNFVRFKFEIYRKDKKLEKSSNLSVQYDNQALYADFVSKHQYAALYSLLRKPELYLLLTEKQREEMETFLDNIRTGIERTGIITSIVDNKPQFLHTTFAEYFAALFLIKQLQSKWTDEEMLLIRIFVQPEYEVMRLFFNDLLAKDEHAKETIKKLWDDKIAMSCNNNKENLLHIACREGNNNVLQFLLRIIKRSTLAKIINNKNSKSNTCLHLAISFGSTETVKMLLENGADPNEVDFDGHTPVHKAAKLNQEDVLRLLLDNDIPGRKYVKNYKDRTPLHYVAKYGKLNLVKMLVMVGDEVRASGECDINGFRPIDLAAKNNHWHVVDWLLDNVNYTYKFYEPLVKPNVQTCAAQRGKIELIKKLLVKAPNVYTLKYAITAACFANQLDTVQYLMPLSDQPPDSSYLLSAISGQMTALYGRNLHVIRYLLSLNITVPLKEHWVEQDDAYHKLVDAKRVDILELLLEHEEDFEESDTYGLNMPNYAAESESWPVLRWLLERKRFDVNAQDNYTQDTVLHRCVDVKNVDLDVLKLVLNAGALLLLDLEEMTPLDVAKKNNHHEAVDLLKSHFNVT